MYFLKTTFRNYYKFPNTSESFNFNCLYGMRWHRYVLRRDDGHVLRKALEFEVKGDVKKRG